MQSIVIKIGHRKYVQATDWDGPASRRGVWIPRQSGGWWPSLSLEHALRTCPNPKTYRTWKAAHLARQGSGDR